MLYNVPIVGMSWVVLPEASLVSEVVAFWGMMLAAGAVLWVVVDAASVPRRVWRRAGRPSRLWSMAPLVALLSGPAVPLAVAAYYVLWVRPDLRRAVGVAAPPRLRPPTVGPFR
ncbi:MAG TPA: hypothetical protein RMF84_18130 [Polyangiaceae bacterium LLY-WYZ-14_1]|jgi:hypothetical protein|nr:hypothetical protein [Polyangiaceae bacterium LLY-WYZ-14_1]